MFIQTEITPNPATLKFIPGEAVLEQGTAFFETPEEAKVSPLARRLFSIEGVSDIFLGFDFISVTLENKDWQDMKTPVLAAIVEHFSSGDPVITGDSNTLNVIEEDPENAEIVAQIKELLEARVRPAVARDGGDIVYHAYDKGVVYLKMQGACAGCPSSTATLKYGIENLLKHYIPEIDHVESV